ncbi:MAG TPA: BatA domain-containing protein [Bacteroidia bacterium]|nr:BatA domain-containing protein [Bacteroidia bacterium]
MNFINPFFLFALSAISIPIIVHLFNFRKFKKIYFTNVKFLREVQQESQSKSRLRNLLILLSRILAIIFLVLAFAEPYIPNKNGKIILGNKAISIYIDNSFSMNAMNKSGSLLDEAKRKALEIIKAYKPTDRFQLLTNDFEGSQQRLINKDEFTELLEDVKTSPAVKTMSEVVARQSDLLSESQVRFKKIFLISDFQKTTANIDKIKNDTSISVTLIPVIAEQTNNAYIDSCWFTNPVRQLGEVEKLNVRICNASKAAIENNSVKLFINDKERTPASFSAAADSKIQSELSFAQKDTGMQQCKIAINDYPITFDDDFYFSFDVNNNIPILSINSTENKNPNQNNYFEKIFKNDSLFVFNSVNQNNINYASFAENKLIVLNELDSISSGLAQEIKKFVNNGGSLLVIPSEKISMNSYHDFLSAFNINYFTNLDTAKTKVSTINFESPIYKNVFEQKSNNMDLPIVFQHYTLTNNTHSDEDVLLKLQNGTVFFNESNFGKGKIYLSTVPFNSDFSNFPKHALFVPTIYNIAINSQTQSPLFYTIGNDDAIELSSVNLTGDNVFHIKQAGTNFDIIPEYRREEEGTTLFLHDQIKQAGNYQLLLGTKLIKGISFNYNRKESDLSCYLPKEIEETISKSGFSNFSLIDNQTKNLTQVLTENEQGKKLWKLCIILALLFLAVEIFLVRWIKK